MPPERDMPSLVRKEERDDDFIPMSMDKPSGLDLDDFLPVSVCIDFFLKLIYNISHSISWFSMEIVNNLKIHKNIKNNYLLKQLGSFTDTNT